MELKIYVLLLYIVFHWIGCRIPIDNGGSELDKTSVNFGFNLTKPVQRYDMPGKLKEISGLAYAGEGILASVNDEEGKVYFFNTYTGEIQAVTKFAKKGDYEGIAVYDKDIFVLKSNGEIYQFKNTGSKEVKSRNIETPFTTRNDLEGLTYSHDPGSLLIACKNKADINDNEVNGRAVYQLDLTTLQVIWEPYINLTTQKFKNDLVSLGVKPANHMPFMLSGISIHPVSGHIYLISSVGRLLLVIDKKKNIISAIPLSRKLFEQPEGICFDEMGNLYIASEGRTRKGYILKFAPKKEN
ncbi:SdiA-regulated domain-containing protein [Bacteroidota bacterium]